MLDIFNKHTCSNSIFFVLCKLKEAALATIGAIREFLDDHAMRKMVLPKAKALFYKSNNPKVGLFS